MKKILCILLIILIFVTVNHTVSADALSDYQKQLDAIKAEQEANIKRLSGLDKEIAQDMYDITKLDVKVTEYTMKLNDLKSKVDDVTNKLAEQEQALQNTSQLYNSAEEIYITRLKVIYENGIPSYLDILFSSKSVTDFFSKINALKNILDYDRTLVNNMKNQKSYLDNVKSNIELQKIQLEQLKYDTEKSAKTLEDARAAKNNKISSLKGEKTTLTEKNKKLADQATAAKKKIEQEIAKLLQDGTKYTGNFTGKFTWPVPGVYVITAMFYDKEYYQIVENNHSGFDIGAPEGNSIVAMADGVVRIAGFNYGGYGNYVLVDHGNSDGYTYATLYAHASALNVTAGQIVTKGQKIATSGNTGFSTGAHVHIEVIKAKYGKNWVLDGMDYFNASQAPFTYKSYGKYISYPFSNPGTYQYKKIADRSVII